VRKLLLAFLLLMFVAMLLSTLSGCATILTYRIDNSEIMEKIEKNWSQEYKEVAKELGIFPNEYRPNYVLPVAGDLLSIYIFYKIGYSETFPVFCSETMDGLAALYSLVEPFGIYWMNRMLNPPPPKNLYATFDKSYMYQKLTKLVEAEIERRKKEAEKERQLKIAKELFKKNPNKCPLKVVETYVSFSGNYLYVTVRNISPKPVIAFKVKIEGYNVFGDRVSLGTLSDFLYGLADNIVIEPLEEYRASWFTLSDTTHTIKVEIIRVLYADGSQWVSQ